ncbi:reprolysin-like metallopeptidase [Nocardioides rubriscoriae]|uniref:reprolysin-like metallopeptidase n=1 Tax=Nocardioides rubriscoriae TaxID=642762 RepID=UPI0011E040E0|nr:M12 family metallo-peptidase [Nocardioides rubriscoriae]
MRHPRRARLAAAVAVVLAAAVVPAVTPSSAAPAADPAFRPLTGFKPSGDKIRVQPTRYAATRVDLRAVRAQLADAPVEGSGSGVDLAVPTPAGGTQRFAVTRSDVLAPELAAAHPEIATYTGRAVDDPTTTIALDVTPMGFHAAVRGPQGQGAWYVDPAYDRVGTTTHLSFYGSATTRPEEAFAEKEAPEVRRAATRGAVAPAKVGGTVVEKRYRLALASDPSYAAYFGTTNVLAEKATLINRVNQIYREDLAITLQLINETDKLNFDTDAKATGPDGPCGAEPCYRTSIYPDAPPGQDYGDLDFCSGELLGRNRLVLGQVIGAANYDIGHIALGKNGGGVAYLGVVGADYKGGGCTGLPEPKGDFFAIDYVAHEMGHQFAGNHTFNGVQYACSGGNRNGGTSVEPGSGSSVMAYAGICLQDDLQAHTDPYFSWQTLDEVNTYTGGPIPSVVEVQTVSLSGFGGPGSGFSLSFGDSAPVDFTPATYDAATLESAIETATGQDVTIAGWGYDPYASYDAYPAPLTAPGPTGFQVIFAPTAAPDAPGTHTDVDPLTVVGTGGATAFVGETAKGGAADNGGTATVTTTDRAPRVTSVNVTRKIPVRTPFKLTGTATDPDGDPLTYLWEQADRGLESTGTGLVSNKKIYGPLFRVFGTAADVSADDSLESPAPGINVAGRSGTRYFPDLAQVLGGNTNARTGACPKVAGLPADLGDYVPPSAKVVECYSEYLPTRGYLGTPGDTPRALHFRLTVRDARGGVAYREVTLRLVPTAGPFRVTTQGRQGLRLQAGSTIPVRWKVNGTRALSERVKVLLSTDGGRTFRRTLAGGTLNDGATRVTLPGGIRTDNARIMVEAAGNYFYSVSAKSFAIR